MTQTEGALGDAGELHAAGARALVAAGNGSYSDAERAGLAERIRGLREQLLSIANRGDGAGGYLFGGQGSAQPPFVDGAGGVSFRGTGGQTEVPADEPLPMTHRRRRRLAGARRGNGVFETAPRPRANGSGAGSTPAAWPTRAARCTGAELPRRRSRVEFRRRGTTYSVLKDGAATALTNAALRRRPGDRVRRHGRHRAAARRPPATRSSSRRRRRSLSVFDTLDRAIAELQTPLRSRRRWRRACQRGLRDIDALDRQPAIAAQPRPARA